MTPALELEGVSVRLGGADAVASVSLAVPPGEWLGLIGPNGAGKTTLLRAVAGLVPAAGAVRLHGRPLASLPRRERGRLVALVPQAPATPAWMTVGEYVVLGRTPHVGVYARERRRDLDAARSALERLDLARLARRRLGTLSGGERQRAVVARALAQQASIVLLDEPTAALDIGHQQQALELIDALRGEEGLTLVVAMHDLTLAAQYVDRMVLLDRGRVVADGPPEAVLTRGLLGRTYEADVEVLAVEGGLAVVPRRGPRETR